jgi:DNA-binding MarR family transcriptional regulator
VKLKELDIWGRTPPEKWVREAADRWARILLRASLLYLALYDASPLSRSETEILFLLLVEDGEKSEPAILAEKLRVSRQTMTGLLDKLETGGYVARAAHPTDRRRKVVTLTRKGLELARGTARRLLHRDAALIATGDRGTAETSLAFVESFVDRIEAWNREHPL